MNTCPKADPASFITWCLMRLEKSEHDRELWRCIKCGHQQIRPNPITRPTYGAWSILDNFRKT